MNNTAVETDNKASDMQSPRSLVYPAIKKMMLPAGRSV